MRLTDEQQKLVTDFLMQYPNPIAPVRMKHYGIVNAYLLNKVGDNDDLNQTAMMAIVRAAMTFDPEHRVLFATYAINGIKLAILGSMEKFNAEARTVPTKMIYGDAMTHDGHSYWDFHPAPEPIRPSYDADELQLLRSEVAKLPKTYETVIRQFYGFDGDAMNLKQIGSTMHLAGPTIRDKKERALKMLRARLARVLSPTPTEEMPCIA